MIAEERNQTQPTLHGQIEGEREREREKEREREREGLSLSVVFV